MLFQARLYCQLIEWKNQLFRQQLNPKKCKKSRNTGKAYSIIIKEKDKARKCLIKCSERIIEEERKIIFDSYWAQADVNL